MSEEHVDEDTEIHSTHELTTSNRSRSPTRRIVDLQIAKKPMVPKTNTLSKDVLQAVGTLHKEIRALARRSKGVTLLGIEVLFLGMLYSFLVNNLLV
jgi:hypothetical protein